MNQSALSAKRSFSPGFPDGRFDGMNHSALNPELDLTPGFSPDGIFANMSDAVNVAFTFEKLVYLQTGTVLFSQKVPFKDLVGNILGLISQVEKLDPSTENNGFVPISARSNNVFITTKAMHPSSASLLCESQKGETLKYKEYQFEKIRTNESIVLADSFTLDGDYLRCFIHDAAEVDVMCIKRLFSTASSNGLRFYNGSPSRIFADIKLNYSDTALYLVVNSTDMWLSASPKALSLCRLPVNDSVSDDNNGFEAITQAKFHKLLGNEIIHILEDYLMDLERLQLSHQLVWRTSKDDIVLPSSIQDVCRAIHDRQLHRCVHEGKDMEASDFAEFLAKVADTLNSVYTTIKEVTDKALESCLTLRSDSDMLFIRKVYYAYLNWFKSIPGTNAGVKQILDLSYEEVGFVGRCVSQWFGSELSSEQLKITTVFLVNAGIDFVNVLDDTSFKHVSLTSAFRKRNIGQISKQKKKRAVKRTENDVQRFRRWVWTKPLSYITGLTSDDKVLKLEENEEKLLVQEKANAVEIGRIENDTFNMLESLKKQNVKMSDLFETESDMEKTLTDLMRDEVSLSDKLSHVAYALEVTSDVTMVYQGLITSVLGLGPEIRRIEDILFGNVGFVIGRLLDYSMVSALGNEVEVSLRNCVRASWSLLPENSVTFRCPRVTEKYRSFKMSSFPYMNAEGKLEKFVSGSNKVIINGVYEFLTVEESQCSKDNSGLLCSSSVARIRRKPVTCAEFLIVPQFPLPPECIVAYESTTSLQDYVVIGDNLRLFTTFTSNVTVYLEDNTQSLVVNPGVHNIPFPVNAILITEFFRVVHPESQRYFAQPEEYQISYMEEFRQLKESLLSARLINESAVFADLGNLTGTIDLELARIKETNDQLGMLKNLSFIHDYRPMDINLENPFGPENTLTAVSAMVLLGVIAISVLGCMVCCAPCRECCFCCCGGICKLFGCMCRSAWRASWKPKKQRVERVTYQRKAPADLDLYVADDIPVKLEWSIREHFDRAVLVTLHQGHMMFYNEYYRHVVDSTNMVRPEIPLPTQTEIENLQTFKDRLEPPTLIHDKGFLAVVNYPDFYFDECNNLYKSRKTGKVVTGFVSRQDRSEPPLPPPPPPF